MSCPHDFNGECSDCADDRERADMVQVVDALERLRGALRSAEAERDSLRAVLATTPENVEVLVRAVGERHITQAAVCTILADQRRRAGGTGADVASEQPEWKR